MGRILLAYNNAELRSPGGQDESEGLFWCHCEDCGLNDLEKKEYGKPEEGKKETRPGVIPYSLKVVHNLTKSAKKFDTPVVLSVPNKLRKLFKSV